MSVFILLFSIFTALQTVDEPSSNADLLLMERNLSDYIWDKRLLIISSDRDSDLLVEQLTLLSEVTNDLEERDLVVIQVSGYRSFALFGDAVAPAAKGLKDKFSLGKSQNYKAILVGKDGTVKQRWETVFDPTDLFTIIDAMPMRIRESDSSVSEQ